MKQAVYRVSKCIGLFAICKWLTRKKVRVLGYHGIWLGEEHFGNFLFMSAEKFASRMAKLNEMGFPIISLNEAAINIKKGSLPDCATVITIDDGWHSTYKYMLPELEKRQFPATLYVTTYYSEKQQPVFDVALQYIFAIATERFLDAKELELGGGDVVDLASSIEKQNFIARLTKYASQLKTERERQELLKFLAVNLGVSYSEIVEKKLFHLVDRAELKEMSSKGIDIQLHTHRHRISFKGLSCLEQEVLENKLRLELVAKNPLLHFCYPSGLYDEEDWSALEKLSMVTATTTESGLVDNKSHFYAWPRILDGEMVSEIEFEAELSGFCEVKRRVLRQMNYLKSFM